MISASRRRAAAGVDNGDRGHGCQSRGASYRQAGNMPPSEASGSASATDASSRRSRRASTGRSSRHRHFVQNAVEHFGRRARLPVPIRDAAAGGVPAPAAATARMSSGLTKSRAGKRRPGARGAQQSLRGARAGAHQDGVVGARAAHHLHRIIDQLVAHLDGLQRLAQIARSASRQARRHVAAPQHRFRRFPAQRRAAASDSSSRVSGQPIVILSMKRSFCASGSG